MVGKSRNLATLLLVCIGTLGVFVAAPHAQRQQLDGEKLALLAKPAVVQVYDGFQATFVLRPELRRDPAQKLPPEIPVAARWTGSGFFITPDGYVATNAHVTEETHLFNQDRGHARRLLLSFLCGRIMPPRTDCRSGSDAYRKAEQAYQMDDRSLRHFNYVVIPDGSYYPYEIKSFGRPVGEGKDIAIIKIEVRNAPTLRVAQVGSPALQSHITVFGYPGAAESVVLAERSSLQVSITDGRISALKNMADAAPVLQISAPVAPGNSGGPVMNDAGDVIGLLTFGGDQSATGFAFAIPSSTLMEFVRTAGALPAESDVDRRYREGLELYWGRDYQGAIQKFEEVRRLFPAHSEVTGLIQRCQEELNAQGIGTGTARAAEEEARKRQQAEEERRRQEEERRRQEEERRHQEEEERSRAARNRLLLVAGLAAVALAGIGGWAFTRRVRTAPASPSATASAAARPTASQPRESMTSDGTVRSPHGATAPIPDDEDRTVVVGTPAAVNLGALACVDGPLSGQRFNVTPEGLYIGRDAALSQIVINDHRVSKRHVWVGPRNGRVVAIDQASTNGTFLNQPGQNIKEATLKSGDTLIVAEPEVGQFVYKR